MILGEINTMRAMYVFGTAYYPYSKFCRIYNEQYAFGRAKQEDRRFMYANEIIGKINYNNGLIVHFNFSPKFFRISIFHFQYQTLYIRQKH